MKPDDYAKLLLDSSFKESANTWVRNAAFMTFQGLALGFFTSNVTGTNPSYLYLLPLALAGIAVSIFQVAVVQISEHYNMIWFRALESWAKSQANLEQASTWYHLSSVLHDHERLPWPRLHSSEIAKCLAIFMLILWIAGAAASMILFMRSGQSLFQ